MPTSESRATPASKPAVVLGVRPLPGKVVVELAKAAETTKSGLLVLPDSAREPMNQGRVYATYQAATIDGQDWEPFLRVGDWVVFSRFVGMELDIPNERNSRLVVLREQDVLTVIDYDFQPETVVMPAAPEVEDVVGPDPTKISA